MSGESLEEMGSYYWDDDDDEDETQQRHAYHPSAASRNSAGQSFGSGSNRSISSASMTPVTSPQPNQNSSGRIYIGAPTNDGNVSASGSLGKIEDSSLSLDEIIRLKKINKAKSFKVNQDRNKWKKSWGHGQNYHQISPKGRKNLKRSQTQMLLEAETFGNVQKPMKKNRRVRSADQSEIKYTPEAGLRILVEQGFVITIRVFENADEDDPDFHARRWRAVVVDVRDKSVQGIGEGRRKQMAKDCASLDFLQNLQRQRPQLGVPDCEILKGVRISPLISKDFTYLCAKLRLGEPTCLENLVMTGGMEKYKFTVIVGRAKFSGTSFILKYAQLKALKKAYDALNDDGLVYELDPVIMGDDCSDGSCYNLNETEQVNIVHSRAPGIEAWKEDEKYLYTPMGALAETTEDHRYTQGDPLNGEFLVSPGAGYWKSPTLQSIRQFIKDPASNNNPEQPSSRSNIPSNDLPTYCYQPAPMAQMSPPVFSVRPGSSLMKTAQSEYMSPMPQTGSSRTNTPSGCETRLQRLNIQSPELSITHLGPSPELSDVSRISQRFGTNLTSQAAMRPASISAASQGGFHGRLPTSLKSTGSLAFSATPQQLATSATSSKRVAVPQLKIPSGFSVSVTPSRSVAASSKRVAVPRLTTPSGFSMTHPSGSVNMTGFGARANQLDRASQNPASNNDHIRRFWHKGLREKAIATINQYEHFPVDHQDKFGGEAPYGTYFGSLPEEQDADENGGVTTRMIFSAHSGSASFNLASYRSRIGLADAIDNVHSVLGQVMKGQPRSKGPSAVKSNPFR